MSSCSILEQDETCSKSFAPKKLVLAGNSSLAYERVKLLGVGGSGLVYLVESKLDGRQFALKVSHNLQSVETCADFELILHQYSSCRDLQLELEMI
jgi:serine/threonine protein kinase